jgi:hypothetical protein
VSAAGLPASGAIVWVVGDEHWTRVLLRAELIERGLDAEGFLRVGHALEALRRGRPAPEVVLIDLRGQRISAARAALLTRTGARLVALGGAVELSDPQVAAVPWAGRLRLPVTVGEAAEAVRRATSP